ncbi:MAG: molybdopterin-dependent oxidoreductase [Coriobacteriales bacterium]|jgi:anaerobic selenocysteine-containing dehydrogenase|nr:molybdopterin-dependent oxidoreductase [Coriobacteriales bacterium]
MAYDKQWRTELPDGTVITRSNTWSPPGSHPVGYGVKVITKNGELIRIEGDDDNPITTGRVNAMNLAMREYTYHPDRIIYPMKRDPKDRGLDKWERITWEEAIDIACNKILEMKEKYGAESIVVFGGTGREACIYYYALAFSAIGTPNCCYTQSGWSCYGPRCSVTDYILGAGYPEMDYAGYFEDRFDHDEYVLPKWIVLWGKEPLPSNGDGLFGHVVIDMMKRGSRVMSIDPRMTWLGCCDGNKTLQLRPQTDTALALGLLNVMIEEDIYDHDFVENWCYGFDELAERAAEYPVEKVADITWVPAEKIREAARLLATEKPVTWAWGLAFDQNKNGVQLGMAFLALTAFTGSIDSPGGITLGPPSALLGKWRMEQRGALSDELWAKRIGAAEWPGLSTGMATTQPDETLDTLESGQPYAIKMGWFNSSNFLTPTCSAQPKRWHDGLVKLEYNVIQDLFMTPTAMAVGDLFLPMSTWAEHDGIVITHYGRNCIFMGPMNKAVTVGECYSDIEVCIAIGNRLNPDWWPWVDENGKPDAEAFFDYQLQELGFTFNDLRERGFYQPGYTYKKHEKGLLRFDGEPGFNTVTGLVELQSTLYEVWGEDSLPYYEEPNYSQISRPQDAEKYPFMATSGARKYSSFHSEHRQVPSLRAIDPWPVVEINPEDAKAKGIATGDWVEVENMFGAGRFQALLTPTILKGIVHCTHGWWFPEQAGEEPNLYGVWKSNFNSLVPHKNIGKLGFGAPYKGVMVNIKRVDGLDG